MVGPVVVYYHKTCIMFLKYVYGDLLTSSDSLAHCVSSDFAMSAGVANDIRLRYRHQFILRSNSWPIGTTARVKVYDDKFIFYLVTKRHYLDIPLLCDIRSTLFELARWIDLLNIKHLSIPLLACGRAHQQWKNVKAEITSVFDNVDITISVYIL